MKTEDISLFHRIVESGGISDTASLLNTPKSTISRRLKSLEDELSTKLFHRSGRELTLTTAGSKFYQATLDTIKELELAVSDIAHKDSNLTGSLKVQILPLPDMIPLFNIILKFMEKHPDLELELYTIPEAIDMIKHGIDVSFRIEAQVEGIDLVAKPILESNLFFYASPDYLAKHGEPQKAADFASHEFIIYRFLDSHILNEIPQIDDIIGMKVSGQIHTNNIIFARQAAIQGRGIVCLPEDHAKGALERHELVKLLPDTTVDKGSYYIVYPSRMYLSQAANMFIDYVIEEISKLSPTDMDDCIMKMFPL
ncbi:LysR family transcriptional regulator [Parashewanella tropica]|uniref:LysR family transcriptional regulator n=1 Tax=Parashewanella tropica TaxID=2547970 RepID=UPI00147920A0|nr:LysR family transcriptional regulator [Parashewanella tropica]